MEMEDNVKRFPVIAFVIILASTFVVGPDSELFAQSLPESPAAASEGKAAVAPRLVALTLPEMPPAGSTRLSLPAPKPPQVSATKKWGVVAGLAMTGTGAVLLARHEAPHQTTCVPYGACPKPGIVKITGATLVGVGVPLTILKLRR
jgi:hypothetical protein